MDGNKKRGCPEGATTEQAREWLHKFLAEQRAIMQATPEQLREYLNIETTKESGANDGSDQR